MRMLLLLLAEKRGSGLLHQTILLSPSLFNVQVKLFQPYCSRSVPRRHCHVRQAQVFKKKANVINSVSQETVTASDTAVIQTNATQPPVFVLDKLNVTDSEYDTDCRVDSGCLSPVTESCDQNNICFALGSHCSDSKLYINQQNSSVWCCSSQTLSSRSPPNALPQPGDVSLTLEQQQPNAATASRDALIALQPARSWTPYLEIAAGLSKARLSGLVVSTAIVGCALAASTNLASAAFLSHPYQTALCLALGTGLTSAAANTVNQIVEIPHDSQMIRTRNRVLVRGLTSPGRAGLFAVGCATTGLLVLYLGTNPLVTGLAAGNLLLYTALYTPLKQMSQANTWIGAWVGAVPPLMGWAAATEQLHSGSLILASLLYVWQFPHFMALSWNLRHEYSKAGYMMTAVLDPALCKRVALRHAVASSFVCLAGAGCSAISLGPWAGCALGLACLPPNIGLIYYAWRFARAPPGDGSSSAARHLFRATLFHLPVVMTAALVGTYFCAVSGVAT